MIAAADREPGRKPGGRFVRKHRMNADCRHSHPRPIDAPQVKRSEQVPAGDGPRPDWTHGKNLTTGDACDNGKAGA
jgi:hypothetical protein